MNSKSVKVGLLAFVVASAIGCSSQVEVRGTVTWNGEPLKEGTIVFEATDPNVIGGSGPIKDGKFSFKSPPGAMRVMIYATRESGKFDPAMGAAPREQFLPARYNTETKLTAEVTRRGPNEFTFPLSEKE